MARDILNVSTDPAAISGLRLDTTPWAIAVDITHHRIRYGEILETAQDGFVLKCLKRAIFEAARDAIAEHGIDEQLVEKK